MEEFLYDLRIPKDRIAVLIGVKGGAKKEIEEGTKTKINVDSKEGDIALSGKDGLGLYSAREIVRAIGRGFNPDVALLLLKPDYTYESIDLSDTMGKSKDAMLRIKGRIIGKDGKSRKIIEELTDAHVVVYGKTIGIIGVAESATVARAAVEMLIRGSPHANVFSFLERKHRDLKREQILGEFSFKSEEQR
ncbi:RNA-processing protein [Candidatus Woesearchaeota archaeon]|nr:RNA-processing protein [Candidatus Woesearchaeota archaeon]